jgi:rod shape determining protein RodA
MTFRDKIMNFNWLMVLVVIGLAVFGTAFQFAVDGGSWEPDAARHFERFLLILGVAIVLGFCPIEWWRLVAWPLYAIALIMLILVELVGVTKLGAQRWLDIGPMDIQPSEIMKIALVLALADYYHRVKENGWKGVFWVVLLPLVICGIPTALVFHQPDLGTGLLLFLSGAALIFFAGLPWRYIAVAAGVAVVAVPLYVLYGMHDYQRDRVLTFLNPELDPRGEGYHIAQSKIAIGSGGFWGRGFLEGSQAQNDFLPEKQTDFIFAAVAEQVGFPGAGGIMLLFAVLMGMMVRLTLQVRSEFGRFAMAGVTVTLACYVFINMGMVMGLLPVVGVPLPLISYGGTAMMVIMTGIALALNIGLNKGVKL